MDFIGPIEPVASNGHRFILVAIDYFTKWKEAASYKSVTKKVLADFVRNNLICRFGVPESIITDNENGRRLPWPVVWTENDSRFSQRVRARNFEVGQLVLKRIFPHQDEYKGKFAPNWQGPYMVRKVLSGGALILSEMDGTVWPKPINSDAIKRYYA
ncbi:uncharacterized protein [Solanum lycopersicum]|uniref:uncharacterized protein n=1 Tax=Solanum lycopersicum TaxID=4081 RepID=UPI003747A9E2